MNQSATQQRARQQGGGQERAMGEQFRAIAELQGDAAWIFDCASGLPTYLSPSALALTGYELADFQEYFRGQRQDPAMHLLCAGLAQRLQRLRDGDQSRLHVVRNIDLPRRDGGTVPLQMTSRILLDADGAPASVVGLLRDMSEARRLTERQRRFASMLNHEFRTPLSTIDGAIQRLEATHVDAEDSVRQRYRKIQTAVDRLIGMMDDYLSPERMDDIGQQRPGDSVSPAELLEEAAAQLRDAGRACTLALGALPAQVRCQPAALRLALRVLIDNALSYSPPHVPIRLAAGRSDGGWEIRVTDAGAGVPNAELARIFNKQYRGSNAVGAGSGLGLYMARSVIDVHGGLLSVENLAQGGAEFRIWIPVQGGDRKYVASEVINSDNPAQQQG